MQAGRFLASTALGVVLAGCGSAPGVGGPVPTVPETLTADVPTLAPTAASPAVPPTAASTGDVSAPTATPAPTGGPAVPAPSDAVPTDVAALAEVIAEDPELAGTNGRQLLGELERVADKPDRRRIERAIDRTRGWAEAGGLHPEVAEAALAALELELARLQDGEAQDDEAQDDEAQDDD